MIHKEKFPFALRLVSQMYMRNKGDIKEICDFSLSLIHDE